jgi:hypothetical protein
MLYSSVAAPPRWSLLRPDEGHRTFFGPTLKKIRNLHEAGVYLPNINPVPRAQNNNNLFTAH